MDKGQRRLVQVTATVAAAWLGLTAFGCVQILNFQPPESSFLRRFAITTWFYAAFYPVVYAPVWWRVAFWATATVVAVCFAVLIARRSR